MFGIIAIYASFNSRPHEEVDRLVSENTALDFLFQLTTSRRGRHIVTVGHFKTYDVSTHDLTKRSTLLIQALLLAFSFQLTTSRRGRLVTLSHDAVLDMCFNSRPHEEVDPGFRMAYLCTGVSTHDLTKRSTAIFTQKVFLSKSLFVLIAYNIFILH